MLNREKCFPKETTSIKRLSIARKVKGRRDESYY
jgi:hypothetical protein